MILFYFFCFVRVLLIIQKLYFLHVVTFIHKNGVYRLSSLILSYVKHMKMKGRYVSFFIAWTIEDRLLSRELFHMNRY